MMTPAEELGLAGLGLAGRVRRALYQIPEPQFLELLSRLQEESRRQQLLYLRDGKEEVVRVLPAPLTALPEQFQYLHSASLLLHNATKRLVDMYLEDPAVREVLRLPEEEEAWLRRLWSPRHREENPVFGRLDAVVEYASAQWKRTLHFLEPNMSGVGGLHLLPVAERVLGKVVLPRLVEQDSRLRLELGQDMRALLMQELVEHLEVLGRKGRCICFVEPKYAGSGPEEQESLATWYHEHFGVEVCHADPCELERRGEEVYYQGQQVDLVYRDYSVQELLELERQGVDVEPMRLLFAQNRVVSSLAAEVDQKACWEVFTDPALVERHFTAEERHVFRRHIPWTRRVAERRTLLPEGREGELLEYARAEREELVLKPNRSYGGQGVCVGTTVSQATWEQALERAAGEPQGWVLQRRVPLPVHEFPVLGADGHLHPEPFYVVMGLAPTENGLSVMGRASQKQVVNVAQRGGLCVVAVGHPPASMLE